MKYVCTSERWKKMGCPDLDSIIYLRKKNSLTKVFFIVVGINYGHKKGIELSLIKK